MMNDTVLAIASRHVADVDEGGRSCRACGRPWPCDVRQIVAALIVTPRATVHGGGPTTVRRTATATRTQRRVHATPTVHS